ncbi:MAG TPA: TonB-dependent receptor [Candidatus Acidoferrales bacterium]|nr:TonB-dependent receptor [Candidatus Acidoferrales bacterium]
MTHLKLLTFAVLILIAILIARAAFANVYGAVRGVVHDPQHRPIQDAMVMLRAKSSDWAKSVTTGANGEFQFNAVPLGEYSVSVASRGFAQTAQDVTVISGSVPVVHFLLQVASANEKVTVSGEPAAVATDSFTPTTLVSRLDIERTPGTDNTNSMAMITDYVPGAYVTHDMLHMRGGHQITWLLDGIPIINTAIAQNLGPQFDPKDLDYVEVNRGSYGAEFGDRTYGVFNVVPRTGFERNNEGELVMTAGNFYQTDDQLSFGSHTNRFAYYASVNGNRSDLGLQPPVPQVVHDAENGVGGFGSFILNVDPSNQLRLMTSVRRDYYQIPYDPNPNDIENPLYPSFGLRDAQTEADAGVLFSWVHTFNSHLLTTVSPFYHYNSGDYSSNPNDIPIATTEDRASTYVGGQASFAANYKKNDLQVGFLSFYQHDNQLFGAIFNDGSGNPPFNISETPTANLETFYIDDRFHPFPWLTLSAGMRPTRFAEGNFPADSPEKPVSESAISPRFGATVTIPKIRWTFRAFYGHYYQAPPIETVSGELESLCSEPAYACQFLTLRGERDEEHQFGVTIPYRGWVLDADTFKTDAANFLDHNNIGASNIFFPLTDTRALIRGWELTLRSPRIAHRAQLHLAYSNQIAEGGGVITGGLNNTDVCPPNPNGSFPYLCPLDHDQRNTLNVGGNVNLPLRSYASTNVYYGSGFDNGQQGVPGWPYPGEYLPGHTTFDLSLGKDFGERFSASVTALNVTNRRVIYDDSVTYGGFHWNLPRQIYVQVRYRFRY